MSPSTVPVVVVIAIVAGCAARDTSMTSATPGALPRGLNVPEANAACATLGGRAIDSGRIVEARWVAAGTERARQPPANLEVGEPLPEHCVVRGRLDERIGADGKPYHTGFELRLPTAWNGRFVYQGGGGNDGIVLNAVGRNTGARGWVDNALVGGAAAVSTDAGHQGPEPQFGLDPQARIEHAYRAHERTARTARTLLAAYYGRAPDRSYFVGCSGGGRQGMMFSQRYPERFDGIVAVAPAMRVAQGASIAASWTVQKLLAIAPRGADGKPLLAQSLTNDDLRVVADAVLARCDADDGLEDGLVQRPCALDPSVLQCPAAKAPGCLAKAQVDALRDVMAGPRDSAGRALYFGWPWDPGIAAPDWRNWTMGTAGEGQPPNARHITLIAGALGHEFATPPDPSLSTINFDFDRDPPRLAAFHRIYGTADDTRLDGFRRRGGKLLFFHGTADPIFSSIEMEDYQRRIDATHGPTPAGAFSRLFLVPGMTHCSGGPATDAFDGLAAITRWVEMGEAPERIVARGTSGALEGASRPLCRWPKVAIHTGSGEPRDAGTFVCR